MKLKPIIILSSIASTLFIAQVFGHCQVPCGVYTDQLRFEQMLEDQKTIEKASKLIHELSAKTDAQSHNQYFFTLHKFILSASDRWQDLSLSVSTADSSSW